MVLIVLAAILIPIGGTAVWATRTVLKTDRFVTTVSDVTRDRAVLDAISTRLTNEVFDALRDSSVVKDLPPALQTVIPIVGGAVRSRVEEAVNTVLASNTAQNALNTAVAEAHRSAMRILQGDGLLSGNALSVQNGTATLNLWPVMTQVLTRLQTDGVIPSSVKIPSGDQSPADLDLPLGVKLPADFGQVVVYRTNAATKNVTLDDAQHALVVLKRGVVLGVILGIALAIAALLVAVDRRAALFKLGIGVTIMCVVLIVVARRVSGQVPNATSTPGGRAVAAALADSLRSSLVRVLLILAVIAVVTAVLARTGPMLMRWAGGHVEVASLLPVAAALVILVVLGTGWGAVIFALAVMVAGLVAVQIARRRAQPPPAAPVAAT